MRLWTAVVGLLGLLSAAPACRADLLSGTVAYDPHTQLYTYSYTVTDTGAPGAWLQEFDIRVGPAPSALAGAAVASAALPVATTAPAGWIFNAAVQPAGGYLGEAGTYWSWFYPASLPPGATVSGFSFTTAAPPAVRTAGGKNYYGGFELIDGLFSLNLGVDSSPGQVVAPALSAAQISEVSAAPEPSALLLGASALLLVWTSRARRRATSPVAPVAIPRHSSA